MAYIVVLRARADKQVVLNDAVMRLFNTAAGQVKTLVDGSVIGTPLFVDVRDQAMIFAFLNETKEQGHRVLQTEAVKCHVLDLLSKTSYDHYTEEGGRKKKESLDFADVFTITRLAYVEIGSIPYSVGTKTLPTLNTKLYQAEAVLPRENYQRLRTALSNPATQNSAYLKSIDYHETFPDEYYCQLTGQVMDAPVCIDKDAGLYCDQQVLKHWNLFSTRDPWQGTALNISGYEVDESVCAGIKTTIETIKKNQAKQSFYKTHIRSGTTVLVEPYLRMSEVLRQLDEARIEKLGSLYMGSPQARQLLYNERNHAYSRLFAKYLLSESVSTLEEAAEVILAKASSDEIAKLCRGLYQVWDQEDDKVTQRKRVLGERLEGDALREVYLGYRMGRMPERVLSLVVRSKDENGNAILQAEDLKSLYKVNRHFFQFAKTRDMDFQNQIEVLRVLHKAKRFILRHSEVKQATANAIAKNPSARALLRHVQLLKDAIDTASIRVNEDTTSIHEELLKLDNIWQVAVRAMNSPGLKQSLQHFQENNLAALIEANNKSVTHTL